MLKYISLIFLLLLQCQNEKPLSAPDLDKDPNWCNWSFVNGEIQINDVVAFYREHYPEYYEQNRDIMNLLSEQYRNRIKKWNREDESFYEFSMEEPPVGLTETIRELIAQEFDTDNCELRVIGCRLIDRNDKYLFNRLYKWYNLNYFDCFHTDIYCDEELFRKVHITEKQAQSAYLLVDTSVCVGDGFCEKKLFYFDEKYNYLFSIDEGN